MKEVFYSGMPVVPGSARKKRRSELYRKAAYAAFAFLFAFGIVIYGLHRPEVNIGTVAVSGTVVLKSATLESAAREELAGKYYYLVPRSNAFFYPRQQIREKLEHSFRRIQDIEIKREGLTMLAILISERTERYLWCGRVFLPVRTTEDDCYFLDSGGFIFSKAPYYSGNLFLEFYGPLMTGENANPVGGTILSEQEFARLMAFGKELEILGFPPQKIFVKTDGDYEFTLQRAGVLLASQKNDFAEKLEYLKLALSTEPLKSQIEKERDGLEYIDIRFGNNVYYKFK